MKIYHKYWQAYGTPESPEIAIMAHKSWKWNKYIKQNHYHHYIDNKFDIASNVYSLNEEREEICRDIKYDDDYDRID